MYQFIKFMIAAVILSVYLFQPAQAEDIAKSSAQVFNSYPDAVKFAEEKGKILHLAGKQFSGYSLLPFGSRKKAYAEAQEKVETNKESMAYISVDRELHFAGDNPPPGSFTGGIYQVITLNIVSLLDLSSENLLNEIQSADLNNYGLKDHLLDNYRLKDHLLGYAKKAEFKDLSKNYREIIRARNNASSNGLYDLTQLIVLHEGKSCADDLIKWSKFHKNPGVRLASYLGLIQFGKTSEVEEILKSEADNSVKDKVQKNLI